MSLQKSTWWSVTAFGGEIEKLEKATGFPEWVQAIYGGREICPGTQTVHFQGAVKCRTQQRFSALKAWLPTSHLEPARNAEALKKYVMKAETSAGEKKITNSVKKYFSADQICIQLAKHLPKARQTDRQTEFWMAVKAILRTEPEMAGQLMNPSLKNWFVNTFDVWLEAVAETSDSITLVSIHDGCKHGEECIGCGNCEPGYFNCPNYNALPQETNASEASSQEGLGSSETGNHEGGSIYSAPSGS